MTQAGPPRNRLLLLEVTPMLALQLAVAIEDYIRRGHPVDGLAPLPGLVQLGRVLEFRVRGDQGGPSLGDVAAALDAGPMTPRLLTYAETGRLLACSESTVKRLVSSGRLPSVRIGGSARVRVADVDALVEGLAGPREEKVA